MNIAETFGRLLGYIFVVLLIIILIVVHPRVAYRGAKKELFEKDDL